MSATFRNSKSSTKSWTNCPLTTSAGLPACWSVAGRNGLLLVKGSIEEVCRRCASVEYRGQRHEFSGDGQASVRAIVDEMLEDGMKVLAVAYKPLNQETLSQEDEYDLILLGYLAFFDAPKESAAGALEKLRQLHVGCGC